MSVVGAVMDYIFDWEADGDRFSFEDSDRFEEDSLCSWISEPESLCNNWRGWRKQNGGGGGAGGGGGGSGVPATPGAGVAGGSLGGPPGLGNAGTGSLLTNEGEVSSLMDLAAQAVARHLPFEVVEHFYQPIPEQLQLRIAFWSFPENEEDIRLYSCLANGSSDEFQRGEMMFKNKSVHDALQIGFHLSATVTPPMSSTQVKGSYNVALVFDRRHITSCTCSCSPHGSTASWCAHVVALCLFRIHQSNLVCLRAPVSESLSRLERDQLQKFAQYLISELPQQILPTAQRLLDELLSSQKTMINTVCGAPDPTAGPSAGEQTTWCLDEVTLHENIKKTLVKFCVPSPVVLSDVNYLSNNAPPAANEWQSLLRPLRGREPEGIWNLLLIVREMFRRSDNNAIPLLEILTEEILACEQIVVWWFNNKTQTQSSVHSSRGMNQNNTHSSQHAASSLCDEIVTLWRLAALNPALSSALRTGLCSQLKDWHVSTIEKLRKSRNSNAMGHSLQATASSSTLRKSDIDAFTGFKPAIEACQLEWNDYLLIGFTRNSSSSWIGSLSRMRSEGEGNRMAHAKGYGKSPVSCTVNVTDGLNLIRGPIRAMMAAAEVANGGQGRKGLYSSGSEGFSEGERRRPAVMDSGEDHISTETVVGSSEDGGTLKESRGGRATLEKLTGKSEDVDSDCGSLPSTPGLQTVSSGPGGFNGSKESPSGSQGMSGGSLGASGGGEAGEQPLWEEQKRDPTVLTPPEPGLAGGAVSAVAVPLQDATAAANAELSSSDKDRDQTYFVGVRKPENKQEIMFALAEALHAHGHVREAGRLARELAEEMIASGPDAGIDSAAKDKKKRVSPYISATLSNASFLCSVLLEDLDCRHLAFRIGLFGLEMARTPATSKSLEVKLAHQESELVIQLKKIPLGAEEMAIIRDRAEKLRDGKLKSRGEALLPITLASFIFDSLCLPVNKVTVGGVQATRSGACLTPPDEKLGFEAAVAALGLKANVSEAEHPLLCEGTRRQKGELAVAMLVHHKDDPQKLARIMDKLLDKEVHQLYKNAPATSGSASSNASSASDAGLGLLGNVAAHLSQSQNADMVAPPGGGGGRVKDEVTTTLMNTDQLSLSRAEAVGATIAMKTKNLPPASKDTDSSAMEEDLEGSGDYKAWEAKFRCANLRTTKKHSVGMASVDSSAPETTSSDNSPTLIRRNAATGGHHGALIHHGPGSDSGSSHKSSDSVGSSGCDFQGVSKAGDNDGPANANDGVALPPVNVIYSRSSTPNVKGVRYKGKNRVMPCVPNQPSEASAHFMFELAKTVLIKAGGSSSTSLFVNQSAANNTNPTGPHRALHLCAFQIGLYALGLNNFVSPNWLSRTYSSHVSWITGQATEIGYPAINILIKTWEGHLTPQEVASLADRASRCRDPNMVRAAAELALSCLPHAQALNPNEIQRALIQCKEQSKDMLQRACLSVEMAAKEGGVYPEVLFEVAKRWYELYEEALHGPLLPGASSASGGIDRNSGPSSRSQRSSDGPTSVSAGTIPIVHVVRDQSNPGMMNPGPLVASATLGQIATYPSGGPLPMPPMSYALPAGQQFQVLHPFLAPQYAYVQSIAPPNFGHYYGIPSPHIPHSQPTMHMAKYPYSGGPQPPYVPSNLAPAFHPNVRPPPPFHPVAFVAATTSAPGSQQQGGVPGGPGVGPSNWGHPPTSYGLLQAVDTTQAPPPQQQLTAPPGGQQGGAMAPAPVPMDVAMSSPVQINYLLAAYRVGMLAMETLARRVHDDRPQIKYARNPPYGEDVKWLHGIAMKLGTSYLQQFCACSVNTIVSPFILLDIAMESANFLAGNNVTQVPQQLRLPMLSSLLQRCLQMFIQCTHTRIHHITQVDYDEFVSIVCSARNAFCMTPDGLTQFNEMLQGLRRSKSCKRELWQRIISALHNSSSI